MTNQTKSNQKPRVVHIFLSTGLALLFIAAFMGGFQGVTPALADANTRYVDTATGIDDSDCTDPGAPCATISFALSQTGNGDEILVGEGTYTETVDIPMTVTLVGGYTISDTLWLGLGGATVVDANGANSPVFVIGHGNSVTVAGFTVQGANHTSDYGGGFFINGASVVISDTLVRDNSTDGSGGGIYIENTVGYEGAQLILINSTFTGNLSLEAAAGVQTQGGTGIRVMIEDSVFTGNIGDSVLNLYAPFFEMVGGRVSGNTSTTDSAVLQLGGSGTISGTEIMSNTTARAIRIWPYTKVSAHNLTIQGNTKGGIFNQGAFTLTNSMVENNSGGDWYVVTSVNEGDPGTERLILDGCTIRGNTDLPGIVALGGTAQVRDTMIVGNDTVANNGDIVNIFGDAKRVDLVNLLVADNKSARPTLNGNAVTSTISLMNVTVAGNSVANFPILAGNGIWTLTNTVVWGNTAPDDMMGIGTFTVNYSDIEGGWEGTANWDVDPRFVDAANGDYRLNVGSPVVDMGTSMGAPMYDIDGTPRDAVPDMGAYEWIGFRIFLPMVLIPVE